MSDAVEAAEAVWAESIVPLDEVTPHLVAASRMLLEAGVNVVLSGACGFPTCLFREAPDLIQHFNLDGIDHMDVSGRMFAEGCAGCGKKAGCIGVRREYVNVFGYRGIAPFD